MSNMRYINGDSNMRGKTIRQFLIDGQADGNNICLKKIFGQNVWCLLVKTII